MTRSRLRAEEKHNCSLSLTKKSMTKRKLDESLDTCEEQSSSCKRVATAQRKQAVAVNKNWSSYTKEDLDIGDLCTIKVEGNTRATTNFSMLPVLLTQITMTTAHNKRYHVCTQDGYVKTTFHQNKLTYLLEIMAEMLSIHLSKTGFKKMLMIMDASALYNVRASCCQCTRNCTTNNRCMCRKLG